MKLQADTKPDLEERIKKLERRVRELEAQPKETHFHYYQPVYQQPYPLPAAANPLYPTYPTITWASILPITIY